MNAALRTEIEGIVRQSVKSVIRVTGGDINEAYCVKISDQRSLFAKCNRTLEVAVFEAEARGLQWLAAANALSVPKIWGCGVAGEGESRVAYLLLEWLEAAPKIRRFDEYFGQNLALLHRCTKAEFGFDSGNYIGRLPQGNPYCSTFEEFYREWRLRPMVERAVVSGYIDLALVARFEQLYRRLPELLGPEEPPCCLHGDLWSGNVVTGPDGKPWLIDPAVYAGHREIDLAMMRLFGGFGERVFESYNESFPLASGYRGRVELFQLYPLLVHVNLFGAAYVPMVERAISKFS